MTTHGVSGASPADGRCRPIDRLRTLITLMVLLHHAVLAYHPYAPPVSADWSAAPMIWRAFPVVDAARAPGFDLLVAFNDMHFMALMFLIAGLFAWRGLSDKGAAGFLRDRARRLGIPFLVAAGVLAPLAYYASYLQAGGAPGLAAYWPAWSTLGVWPAGPAWFLWVLLAFSALAALFHRLAPGWGAAVAARSGAMAARPSRLFLVLVVLSATLYLPLSQTIGAMHWFEFGPFTAQSSRVGHYALYFAIGAVLGTQDLDQGLMRRDGALARHWLRWSNLAALVFVVSMAAIVATFIAVSKGTLGRALWISADLGFAVSGAAISLMWLALCARFGHGGGRVWASLARNAYGMFLVHYVYVAWLQYALLDAPLHGVAKGALVFVGTVLLSWGTTAALRRIPALARVI
jgi:hypothetical protein